jgi:hypothetical protein
MYYFNNDYQYKGFEMNNCFETKNKNDLVKPTGCTC